MTAGPRSRPPDLPNFTYETWLGGGGFADVFLYRQVRPDRLVAVKVLRTESMDAEAVRAFDSEADLMAKVSAHPYIVTIYGADIAPDGRAFIVMEYYAKPHFGRRLESGALAVPEVLRLGVRIASAVQTAHRAGILHRDIKPDNILVNDYDRPGLTDFGIAEAREAEARAQGLTLAFAPPEAIDGSDGGRGSIAGDVYSLAATLYKLLATTAPFEVRGGDNSQAALIARSLNAPVLRLSRGDVPQSLELLLQHAMARRPTDRPPSAESFGRALQAIEHELRLAPTEFELAGAPVAPLPRRAADEEATRAKAVQVVREEPIAGAVITGVPSIGAIGSTPPAAPPVQAAPRPKAPVAADTVARPARVQQPPDDSAPAAQDAPSRPDRRVLLSALGGGAVLLAVVIAILVAASGGGSSTSTTTTTENTGGIVIAEVPPIPTGVSVAVADGTATVTWTAPGAKPGDSYVVLRVDGAHAKDLGVAATSPSLQVSGIEAGAHPCFQVVAVRSGTQSHESEKGCAS